MSGELIKIEGELRDITGKSTARKLRRDGKIPGNLLDAGKSTPIILNPKMLGKVHLAGGKFELVLAGKSHKVAIKELQIDHVRRVPLHLDIVPVR